MRRGDVIVVRYADDIVVGFEQQVPTRTRASWRTCRRGLPEFGLTLNDGQDAACWSSVAMRPNAARQGPATAGRKRSTSLGSRTSVRSPARAAWQFTSQATDLGQANARHASKRFDRPC
ncbi:MAG: hypothetical protein MZW92_81170 [Comamonadaceae bacterium]|nr:hypothetical protein [Comamonadaceae bacterium]